MRILSVEVEQYRGVAGPLSLTFKPGLNVIYGPNEIGKSTLLAAIWDGLTLTARGETERHRSIQPHGDGRPRVKVVFVRGGVTYTIEKLFAGKSASKSALRVSSPAEGVVELAGTEAEERLRGVLGVGETARSGELKPEDQGVWPLVRVLQGESGRSPNEDVKTESARASLGERLASLSGAVLGGEGWIGDLKRTFSRSTRLTRQPLDFRRLVPQKMWRVLLSRTRCGGFCSLAHRTPCTSLVSKISSNHY
ncbi:AAA family ATPase [Myxococcota bacterium]|nr:AAA family ATPase [Myxococcota bacterium]